jgi:hypothetical protein
MIKKISPKTLAWPDTLNADGRIGAVRERLEKLKDHLSYSMAVRESNILLLSARIRKQIPVSYAANCYNVLVISQLRSELACLTALWDTAKESRNSIPTLYRLISSADVQSEIFRRAEDQYQHVPEYSDIPDYIEKRRTEERVKALGCVEEIAKLVEMFPKNRRYKKILDYRNEVVAHSLSIPGSAVAPLIIPKTKGLWDYTIKCVSLLSSLIDHSQMDWEGSESQSKRNATQFWRGIRFTLSNR